MNFPFVTFICSFCGTEETTDSPAAIEARLCIECVLVILKGYVKTQPVESKKS